MKLVSTPTALKTSSHPATSGKTGPLEPAVFSNISSIFNIADLPKLSKKDAAAAAAAVSAMSFIVGNANKTKFGSKKMGKPATPKPSKAGVQFEIARRRIEQIDLTPKLFHMYSKAGPSGP